VTDLLPELPENWERCLVVAAHPDDIEYGTAGAVARWTTQGKQVTYLLATRGEAGIDGIHPDQAGPLREAEERAGAREVGVDVVEFLDYRDGVVEGGLPLRRDIARAIRRHRPEIVVSGPYEIRMRTMGNFANQADHRVVGLAALDAARDAGNRWIFPELLDEGLEPWDGVRYVCYAGGDTPTHGVDVTGEPLRRCIASLRAHEEYNKGVQMEAMIEQFLTWMAGLGGKALGVESAVLFDVHVLRPEGPPPWVSAAG
jgi:LmbE family N-acetylglucosaminyl deacetylase